MEGKWFRSTTKENVHHVLLDIHRQRLTNVCHVTLIFDFVHIVAIRCLLNYRSSDNLL